MESKVIDYELVAEYNAATLNIKVKEWIQKGYEPIGGVSVVAPLVNESPVPLFSQALIKREG